MAQASAVAALALEIDLDGWAVVVAEALGTVAIGPDVVDLAGEEAFAAAASCRAGRTG